MGWFMWEQRQLIDEQREEIRNQDEIILQMEKLIDTQFKYIEKFVPPPTYYNPPQDSPIYKSI